MKQNSPITENFVITLMVRCRRLLIQISRENHRNHARKFYPFNHFVGFINYKLQNNIISVRPNTEDFLYWIVHFINWWIFGYNWQNFETETKQWRDGNYEHTDSVRISNSEDVLYFYSPYSKNGKRIVHAHALNYCHYLLKYFCLNFDIFFSRIVAIECRSQIDLVLSDSKWLSSSRLWT